MTVLIPTLIIATIVTSVVIYKYQRHRKVSPNIPFLRPKAVVTRFVRWTAGGRHAWVQSSAGLIRKPVESLSQSILHQSHDQ